MIIYTGTKIQFTEDVRLNRIEEAISAKMHEKFKLRVSKSEVSSWRNSLNFMFNLLIDPEIPSASRVAIEYNIPLTNRRVDFMLTGKDRNRREVALIIELKQWSDVHLTDKDAIVATYLNGGLRETNHPSYQAWSYAAMIEDYNETVRDDRVFFQPCAYLHNLHSPDVICHLHYKPHVEKAPVFIANDAAKLAQFIKSTIRYGDSNNLLYRIEHGKIKPSKTLAESLQSMLSGNSEFVLLDEQKLAYETSLKTIQSASPKAKKILIVYGGPGTGKSVIAINLLVAATSSGLLSQYVTKNAAPREVFKSKLTGTFKKTQIESLFRGSGSFTETPKNQFDVLIVDEAHRLNAKSGLYGNLGENQVLELIRSAKATIFFLDEDQRVTLSDIGTAEEIRRLAKLEDAQVEEIELISQFRCNGSDGYLAWIDQALQIRDTANLNLEGIDYEFRVFDDPQELHNAIYEKNRILNRSRVVAGYCWDWKSKSDPNAFDIEFPAFRYKARWNLSKDGPLWLISQDSVKDVGCIHTCQGLDLDYVGVIIGPDLLVRDGMIQTDGTARSNQDRSIRGFKTQLKTDRASAIAAADRIIKNTYRTLMTRGMKGCFIYSEDWQTRDYFKAMIANTEPDSPPRIPFEGLSLPVIPVNEERIYDGYVPVFDVAAAAGGFDKFSIDAVEYMVELPEYFATRKGQFVIQVLGESMNLKIPNGAWCLFNSPDAGPYDGRILLVQHQEVDDPDNGGSLTVKRVRINQEENEDGIVTSTIELCPESSAYGYSKIVISGHDTKDLRILGELAAVLS